MKQYRIEYVYMEHKLYGLATTLEEALEEAKVFLKAGFKEIQIVRVN